MERRVPPPPPPRRLAAIPKVPPPPPRRVGAPRKRPPPPPPAPSPGVSPSTRAKVAISKTALELRDEQLAAKVQYYGDDQQTNKELDQITQAVVDELKELRVVGASEAPKSALPDVEVQLMHTLRELLEKLFSPQRTGFLKRKIQDVQRRITRLFFNSELYAQLAEEDREVPAAEWPEQALYYALKRQEAAILADLEAIPVTDPAVRAAATERLHGFTRMLCSDFLSRTTPELERLLRIYSEELTRFFYKEFPDQLGEFCWEVIRESRVARGHRLGYKLTEDKFKAFRSAFDKKFLEHLVMHVQGPINRRAGESQSGFRTATMQFVADPRIHTEICSAINDALYDYLHGEGFLDLPPHWRQRLQGS